LTYVFRNTDLKGVEKNDEDCLFDKLFEINNTPEKLQSKIKKHCHFDQDSTDATGSKLVMNNDDKTFTKPVSVQFAVLGTNINDIVNETILIPVLEDNSQSQLLDMIKLTNSNVIKNDATMAFIQDNSTIEFEKNSDNSGTMTITIQPNEYGWTGTIIIPYS
jgi:hypothetical protein